jgi:hypothetical protein
LIELNEAWQQAINEAEQKARLRGRGDVAEYLALRASNDQLRAFAIEWLFATFTALAGEANRAGASIQIIRTGAHRFRVGTSTMVGARLTFRAGLRAFELEAGWPRAPRDGVVRGGGLARAHIKHLGLRLADTELLLTRAENGFPQWLVLEKTGAQTSLQEDRARSHISYLLNAS